MAQSIFSLFGEVFVDTGKAEDSLHKTEEKAGSVAEKLGTGIKTAAKWGTAIVGGATAAAGAMIGVANKAAEQADEIDKASTRMGISAESYQELAYASEQCGVEMSVMEKAAKSLEGTDMSMDEAMASIMALSSEEERAAKAAELFGEGVAYKMAPLLAEGADGFNGLKDRAHELGIVMSDEAVANGTQFSDLMDDLKNTAQSLGAGLASTLFPILNDLMQTVIGFMPTIQQLIADIGPALGEMLQEILPPLIDLVSSVLPIIIDILKPLIPILTQILSTILPPLTQIIGGLAKVIGAVLTSALNAVMPLFDNLKNYLNGLITFVKGVFTGNWKQAWEGVKQIFKSVFEGLVNMAKAPLNAIIGLINKAFASIGSINVPDWVPVIGGKNFSLPQIPLLANGGTINASGTAIVGEAGAELIEMPRGARVTPLDSNDNFTDKMDRICDLLEQFMPMVGQGKLVLDTGALVGGIAPQMNTELGKIANRGARR